MLDRSTIAAEPSNWLEPENTPNLGKDDLAAWRETVDEVRTLGGELKLSRGEVSRRAAVPQSTFSPWYDGKYTGSYANITARIRQWLEAEIQRQETRRALIAEPGFVETPTAKKLIGALRYAQTAPAMIVVTLGPGCGKSTTAKHVASVTPHAYRVVMRPTTGSTHPMLREIAKAVGVLERDPGKLATGIGERLKRNGRHTLLIMDEAQNLSDAAVNELRFFMDEFGTGIALLGNEDVHAKFGGSTPREGYGQLHRRIGMRIRQINPTPEDIDVFITAWGLDDPDINRLLRLIGRKHGALGQITETLKLAAILASGRGEQLSAADIRSAWINRGGEELK